MDELLAFSRQAIAIAIPEIEKTKSFLPFGAVLIDDDVFEQVVYHDPIRKPSNIRNMQRLCSY